MDEWLTPKDAGRLAGSERRDGRWMVRRSEVDRILEEREAARERRMARWRPMTERPRVAQAPDAPARQRPWSAEEDAVLCARIDEPVKVTASLLGRSTDAVQKRRARLRREGRA